MHKLRFSNKSRDPASNLANVRMASLTAANLNGQLLAIMACGEFQCRRLLHAEVRHEIAVGP